MPFEGDIDEYQAKLLKERGARPSKAEKPADAGSKKDQRKAAAEAREQSQALRKRARSAEAELERLTAERSAIDQAMFDPKGAAPALAKLTMTELMKRRADLETRIAAAELAWLEASEALETTDG